ncbi:hypothetical protein PWT90_07264 [Aphanocladium album]|nr:hypothetical protein PWT90_07264 [Aphanocladium album]
MDSRYGAYSIPRRPVAGPSASARASPVDPPPPYEALPGRPPLPPRLRSSKSASRLHQSYERHQPPPPELPSPLPLSKDKHAVTLPPGFVFEEAAASSHSPPAPDQVRRAKSSTDLRPQTAGAESSFSWKKALDEAQYLAGGLISSPVESTKHYSIIRHSGALVWYRGPDTTVTVTILSDEPLPPTRTLWLQQKGYSGNMGMSLKAMVGTNSSWLDVTPATEAQASHIPINDERGVQRDMKRFAKKATGRMRSHLPRETHVVRIPAASQDGYFRIVLCPTAEGKKVLCGSPVFRVASTSSDVSVVRGAGIRTMPLELGAKVASTIGSATVNAYVGAAAGAVKTGVGSVTGAAVKKVGKQAYQSYEITGMGDAVRDKVTGSWHNSATARYERAVSSAMMEPTVGIVGREDGPERPFPIKFTGKVVRGSGYTFERYGFPTANLVEVPEELTIRMTGAFAAWVKMAPQQKADADEGDLSWYEAVVSIAPAENAAPSVVSRNLVTVHILHDFDGADFYGTCLKVLLMGFLRPKLERSQLADVDACLQRHADDILTSMATLARARWQPQETVDRMRMLKGERSWSERLDGVTGIVVARVDRVPMHRAGIRSEAGALRDRSYGNGGLWIRR